MQDIILHNTMKMTSIEIAELTDKRHDNVKRTIETLIQRRIITSPQIEEKPTNGRPVTFYIFEGEQGKRDSIIVVAQLCPEFTARLVDRWQELENKSASPISVPQNLPDALRLAADLAEKKAELENQLAIAAPKAQFVDSYVNATGSLGFRETCKLLNIKENEFRNFLLNKEIMYILAGKITPYSKHIDAGRFTVKTGEANGHAFTQNKFTPKGIQWIAGLWAVNHIQEHAA